MKPFPRRLLAWYGRHARALPWRGHPDPYAVWVSEIMLQQTRVDAVIPYFERWMARFPDVRALAAAREQDVLKFWEGLGYYSRARNLHKAAKIVSTEYGGQLPAEPRLLRSLPGIGAYTAGAIASIAFGRDAPTLDGNLRRVLSRVFDVTEPTGSPAGERRLWQLAAEQLPAGRAGDYNQALMDLGATICLPRNPLCNLCPLEGLCRARALGIQASRPVLKPRKRVPHYQHAAGVIVRRGRVLLARRPSSGLLGGMWEFPNARIEGDPARGLASGLRRGYRLRVRGGPPLGIVSHAYTHFKVTVHAFRAELLGDARDESLRWIRLTELDDYPMGKIDRQIARKLG